MSADRGRLSGYAAMRARSPKIATPRPSAAPVKRQEAALDHELAQQTRASCAEGAANGELLVTRLSACEQ